MDLAELNIVIKSTQVQTARERLDALAGSAKRLEATEQRLHGQTQKTGAALDAAGNAAVRSGRSIAEMDKRARRASGGLATMIKGLVGVAAAALAIRKSVSVIAQFEQSMKTLQGVTRASADELQQLEAAAREMGATTRFSATQAADGLLFLARAGFDTQEAIEALPATLDLAQAGALGLGEAADIASNVLSQFNLEAEETVRIADVLVAATNRTNSNIQQMAEAFKFAGPIAGNLGITIEETAAAIGILGNSGIQASLAGTNLRGIFSALLGPTKDAEDAIRDLGLTLEDVSPAANTVEEIFFKLGEAGLEAEDAVRIFARRNQAAALILADARGELGALTKELEKASGEAKRNADIMDDSVVGAYHNFLSAVTDNILALGDSGLAGALKNTLKFLAEFTRGIRGGADDTKTLGVILNAIGPGIKAIGTGIAIFASLTAAINLTVVAARALTAALAANPVTLVALGVSALATGVLFLTGAFENESKAVQEANARLAEHEKLLTSLGDEAKRVGEQLRQTRRLEIAGDLDAQATQMARSFFLTLEKEFAEGRIDELELERIIQQVDSQAFVGFAKDLQDQLVTSLAQPILEAEQESLRAWQSLTDTQQEQLLAVQDVLSKGLLVAQSGVRAGTEDLFGFASITQQERDVLLAELGLTEAQAREAAAQIPKAIKEGIDAVTLEDVKLDILEGGQLISVDAIPQELIDQAKELGLQLNTIDGGQFINLAESAFTAEDAERLLIQRLQFYGAVADDAAAAQERLTDARISDLNRLDLAAALESTTQALKDEQEALRLEAELGAAAADVIERRTILRQAEADIRQRQTSQIDQALKRIREEVEATSALATEEQKKEEVARRVAAIREQQTEQRESALAQLAAEVTATQQARAAALSKADADDTAIKKQEDLQKVRDKATDSLRRLIEEMKNETAELQAQTPAQQNLLFLQDAWNASANESIFTRIALTAEALKTKQALDAQREATERLRATERAEERLQTAQATAMVAQELARQVGSQGPLLDDLLKKEKLRLDLMKQGVAEEDARRLAQESVDTEQAIQIRSEFTQVDPQNFIDELEQLQEFYDQRRELILSNTQLTEEEKTELLRRLGQEQADMQLQITLAGTSAALGATSSFFKDLSTLTGGKYKEIGEIAKGAAIAQATIDTAAAGIAAYKAMVGIPVVGPALAVAAAAAATAAGAVQIQAIQQQQFAKGGAFDGNGVQFFQNGGAFGGSGSLLTSPTAFSFGNGQLGIAGEVGPEAVLPLARARDGALGVRAVGQQQQQAAPAQAPSIKIVNVLDMNEVTEQLASREGEKVILNVMRRNGSPAGA